MEGDECIIIRFFEFSILSLGLDNKKKRRAKCPLFPFAFTGEIIQQKFNSITKSSTILLNDTKQRK